MANIFFWMTFALFDILSTGGILNGYYSAAAIRFFFHALLFAILIYVNLYVLYPRFFSERQYLLYSITALILITSTFFLRVALDEYFIHTAGLNSVFGGVYDPITARKALQNFTDARFYSPEYGFQSPYYVGMATGTIGVFFITSPLKLVEDWYNKKQLEIQLLQKELQQQQDAIRIREEKLKFLKAQTDPHFLINAITGVYHLELIDSDQVDYALLRLSELMGYLLGYGKQDFIALKHELQFIENYINFNKTIHLNEFEVQFQHNASGKQVESIYIPPMLLQPFFENAFKYADNANGKTQIISQLEVGEKSIRFCIENPINTSKFLANQPSSHGIGIKNVQERLKLYLPEQHSLVVERQPHLFKVELELFLNTI
ncbi:MAG: histidine kinase [Saprospiraceae bacterium]|nr:histidine kinase [Saprospiraceae bacterium]